MNAMTYNQARLQPRPPEKGSFPLDHDGTCKSYMMEYMTCLRKTDMDNSLCRELSKSYLKCRMDNNLMTKEEWKYLGYKGDKTSTSVDVSQSTDKTTPPSKS